MEYGEGGEPQNRAPQNAARVNESHVRVAAVLGVIAVVSHDEQISVGNGCAEDAGFPVVAVAEQRGVVPTDLNVG